MTFEDYYMANDDDYRMFGTSYHEQTVLDERGELSLQEQLTLVTYKIRVLTKWVNAVDQETDDALTYDYKHLSKRRDLLQEKITNANNK